MTTHPSLESPEAAYQQDFHSGVQPPYVLLGGAAFALLAILGEEKRTLGFFVVTGLVLLSILQDLWNRRYPRLSVLPWGLRTRTGLLLRTRELSFPEITSWVWTERYLGMLTLGGERVFVNVASLSGPDRERLAHLLTQRLGAESSGPLTAADVVRLERRRRLLVAGAVALGVALAHFAR